MRIFQKSSLPTRTPAIAAIACLVAGLGVTAPAAHADSGTITPAYSNGSSWPAAPTGPQLMYGQKQTVLALSSTGQAVAFAVSGGCTVEAVASSAPSSQAQITGTSGDTDCTVTMTSPAGNGLDAASVTYTMEAIPTGQTVKYGSVMSKSTVKLNKTYVLAAYPLKTDKGKTVTFKINTGSKYCSVTKSTSKGWRLKVGSKTGKCSVIATAAAVPPNYAAVNRKQFWSVVK